MKVEYINNQNICTKNVLNYSFKKDKEISNDLKTYPKISSKYYRSNYLTFGSDKEYNKQHYNKYISVGLGEDCAKILSSKKPDFSSLSFWQKTELLDQLETIKMCYLLTSSELSELGFDSKLEELKKSIETASFDSVSQQKKPVDFFNKEDIETIKNTDFVQYGKLGLSMLYTRQDFLRDLTSFISKLSKKEQTKTFNLANIKPIFENEKIVGYDGLIKSANIVNNDEINELYNIINKFLVQNKVTTQNKELNKALNRLVEQIPEFINVISKKQHANHANTLDIHILQTLSNALKNPEFEQLDDENKVCLIMAILLHDIAKRENMQDSLHPYYSGIFAKEILNKFDLSEKSKQKIINLIQNHHWLKDYSTYKLSADGVAKMFSNPAEWKMAKIMADADIKAISARISELLKSSLSYEHLKPIDDKVNKA